MDIAQLGTIMKARNAISTFAFTYIFVNLYQITKRVCGRKPEICTRSPKISLTESEYQINIDVSYVKVLRITHQGCTQSTIAFRLV